MSKVMKIAGNYNDAVKGVSVDSSGAVNVTGAVSTSRGFANTTCLDDVEIRDTLNHRMEGIVDLSGAVFVSLRVRNGLDQPVTLRIYSDLGAGASSTYLSDADGNSIVITIPANSGHMIITPDDIPVLPYLKFIHLGVKADDAPTTGTIGVRVVTKG